MYIRRARSRSALRGRRGKTDNLILPLIVLAFLLGALALGGRWARDQLIGSTEAPSPGAYDAPPAQPDPEPEVDGWPVEFEVPEIVEPRFDRVVLVTLDTLRSDHVSSYGYVRETMPFFDSLAERGVLFENTIASVSHTAPSHASMLTGLPPEVHGVLQNFNELDPEAAELGRIFRTAGFETSAFLSVKFLAGIAPGFDFVDVQLWSGKPVVDSAIAWLRTQRSSERFFMWVHLYDPHRWKERGKTPREELALMDAEAAEDPVGFYDYLAELHGLPPAAEDGTVDLGWKVEIKGRGRLETRTRDDYLKLVNSYDAQILFSDRLLQRLYEAIERIAFKGPTLYVVTSDHGEGLASHEVAGHGGRIYQEQLRVPLLVHASDGSLGPRRVSELTQLVDVFPTLATVVQAELKGLDPLLYGASLWPLIEGRDGWRDRPAFSQRRPLEDPGLDEAGTNREGPRAGPEHEEPDELYAMQSDRFKYILHVPGDDEFFDLQTDPLELSNLVSEESRERDALKKLIEDRLQVFRNRQQAGGTGEVSEEILQELRDLGYVE